MKPGKNIQPGNLTLGHIMKRYIEAQFPMVTAFIVEFCQQLGVLIIKANLNNNSNLYEATKHCTKCYGKIIIFALV